MFWRIFWWHFASFDCCVDVIKQVWGVPLWYVHVVETKTGFRRFHAMAGNAEGVEELLCLLTVVRSTNQSTEAHN